MPRCILARNEASEDVGFALQLLLLPLPSPGNAPGGAPFWVAEPPLLPSKLPPWLELPLQGPTMLPLFHQKASRGASARRSCAGAGSAVLNRRMYCASTALEGGAFIDELLLLLLVLLLVLLLLPGTLPLLLLLLLGRVRPTSTSPTSSAPSLKSWLLLSTYPPPPLLTSLSGNREAGPRLGRTAATCPLLSTTPLLPLR